MKNSILGYNDSKVIKNYEKIDEKTIRVNYLDNSCIDVDVSCLDNIKGTMIEQAKKYAKPSYIFILVLGIIYFTLAVPLFYCSSIALEVIITFILKGNVNIVGLLLSLLGDVLIVILMHKVKKEIYKENKEVHDQGKYKDFIDNIQLIDKYNNLNEKDKEKINIQEKIDINNIDKYDEDILDYDYDKIDNYFTLNSKEEENVKVKKLVK